MSDFEMASDHHKNLLETTNVTSIPGVKNGDQDVYDELLKMIDKMIEHSDKARVQLELQKQADIGKPEELADRHQQTDKAVAVNA